MSIDAKDVVDSSGKNSTTTINSSREIEPIEHFHLSSFFFFFWLWMSFLPLSGSRVVDSFWCTGVLLRFDCKLFSVAQNVIGEVYLLVITYFSVLF